MTSHHQTKLATDDAYAAMFRPSARHDLYQPAGLEVMAHDVFAAWIETVTTAGAWGVVGCPEAEARAAFARRFLAEGY